MSIFSSENQISGILSWTFGGFTLWFVYINFLVLCHNPFFKDMSLWFQWKICNVYRCILTWHDSNYNFCLCGVGRSRILCSEFSSFYLFFPIWAAGNLAPTCAIWGRLRSWKNSETDFGAFLFVCPFFLLTFPSVFAITLASLNCSL